MSSVHKCSLQECGWLKVTASLKTLPNMNNDNSEKLKPQSSLQKLQTVHRSESLSPWQSLLLKIKIGRGEKEKKIGIERPWKSSKIQGLPETCELFVSLVLRNFPLDLPDSEEAVHLDGMFLYRRTAA